MLLVKKIYNVNRVGLEPAPYEKLHKLMTLVLNVTPLLKKTKSPRLTKAFLIQQRSIISLAVVAAEPHPLVG